jgi:hypothetical protein
MESIATDVERSMSHMQQKLNDKVQVIFGWPRISTKTRWPGGVVGLTGEIICVEPRALSRADLRSKDPPLVVFCCFSDYSDASCNLKHSWGSCGSCSTSRDAEWKLCNLRQVVTSHEDLQILCCAEIKCLKNA